LTEWGVVSTWTKDTTRETTGEKVPRAVVLRIRRKEEGELSQKIREGEKSNRKGLENSKGKNFLCQFSPGITRGKDEISYLTKEDVKTSSLQAGPEGDGGTLGEREA